MLKPPGRVHAYITDGPDPRLPTLITINNLVTTGSPQNCPKPRIVRLWYGESSWMPTLLDRIGLSLVVCLARLTNPGFVITN